MLSDLTPELSPEQIDSLIEDMQRKAEEGEEGYTDEQFEQREITTLITAINEPRYKRSAPIDRIFTKSAGQNNKSHWEEANDIKTIDLSEFNPKISIAITYQDGTKTEFQIHKYGNIRILEDPDYVYIQITSQGSEADNPYLELFIPKDDWEKDNPTLRITSRIQYRKEHFEE